MNNNFCDTVITIPQSVDTCWFNALLMMIFYSQYSRKLLLHYNNFLDKHDELSIIFKAMLYKSYIKNYQVYEYLIEKSPHYILDLLKFENKTIDGEIIKNDYGYQLFLYIHTFLKYLNLEYLILTTFGSKKFYIDIFELVKIRLNDNILLFNFDNLITDNNIRKKFIEKIKNKIKNEIPKYIIINLKINNYIFNDFLNSYEYKIQDFLFDNNMIKNLNRLPNEIEYKGYTYILDSMQLSNYNSSIINMGHTICGITCKKKRFIYNGWMINTKDPAMLNSNKDYITNFYPCQLMPFNWNVHKNIHFCLNTLECKLDTFLENTSDGKNRQSNKLCFSFYNKNTNVIVYVLKDENFISLDHNVSSPYINEIKKEVKECPKDKIYNPKTKKCVLKSSKIGKSLLLKINKKEIKKEIKECPKDKIYNPETKRCVLKSGKIGKLLLSNIN